MNQATEHVKENKMMYMLLTILLGAGGTATITNNLPVTQGEFQEHVEAYAQASSELEQIQGSLHLLILNQLRASLLQAYKDKCSAVDPQAINYINREIESLQSQYVTITGRRFDPPPCGS
jgi:hypothetical protein